MTQNEIKQNTMKLFASHRIGYLMFGCVLIADTLAFIAFAGGDNGQAAVLHHGDDDLAAAGAGRRRPAIAMAVMVLVMAGGRICAGRISRLRRCHRRHPMVMRLMVRLLVALLVLRFLQLFHGGRCVAFRSLQKPYNLIAHLIVLMRLGQPAAAHTAIRRHRHIVRQCQIVQAPEAAVGHLIIAHLGHFVVGIGR